MSFTKSICKTEKRICRWESKAISLQVSLQKDSTKGRFRTFSVEPTFATKCYSNFKKEIVRRQFSVQKFTIIMQPT